MSLFLELSPPIFNKLFNNIQDPISILENGVFVECNNATLKMLGMSLKDELIGKTPWEISPQEQPDGISSKEKVFQMLGKCCQEGANRFEWEHLRSDGTKFTAEIVLTRVPEMENQTIFVLWRDISEMHLLQEHLRQTEKMEAIGQLASGLAHDFSNLIGGILGNAELLEHFLKGQTEALEHVTRIKEVSKKAHNLTRQLLDFSRKGTSTPVVVNINTIISETIELIRSSLGSNIKIEKNFLETDTAVKGDFSQIQNAVINLVFNARDAMPEGGTIQLATSEFKADGVLRDNLLLKPGFYIKVLVKDSGTGISKEIIGKIFEPFFTTKIAGKGTGLGLASVYKTAVDHQGIVTVKSILGKGSTFELYLPKM